jgi:hypothetical protein
MHCWLPCTASASLKRFTSPCFQNSEYSNGIFHDKLLLLGFYNNLTTNLICYETKENCIYSHVLSRFKLKKGMKATLAAFIHTSVKICVRKCTRSMTLIQNTVCYSWSPG